MKAPEIRYAQSGEVDIAYTTFGAGPTDIVCVPGFISNLDLCWEIPGFSSLFSGLQRLGRVTTFDKRGTGLSGRDLGFGSAADRMDDIRVVMDAAGLERAHLFGISEGGPLSLLFAATYPDRVQSLTIYGSFAAGELDQDVITPEETEGILEYVRERWGTGEVLGFLLNARDANALPMLGRYERASASPRLVVEIQRRNFEIDVRSALPTISAPTLVLHRTKDPVIRVEQARAIAEGVPGATLVELPGTMHCAWTAVEWAPALDATEAFLTGTAPTPFAADRVLATVLFTDIVDSTRRASDAGDRAWRDLLDQHDAESGRIVTRFGGRLVKQTGDGMLATFDGPARAVACAQTMRDAFNGFGLPIRAGLHTGEVERRGDDIGGIAVHIGARVAGQAGDGEVLVSRTVRDLLIGSELRFEDRGSHVLKGVPDEWQLYAAVT